MKKVLLGLLVVSFTVLVIPKMAESKNDRNDILLSNVEALTVAELPAGWIEGQTMRFRTIIVGWYFVRYVPVPIFGDRPCCVDATEYDACDGTKQDPRCQS